MGWTGQQRAAIELRRASVGLSAGAGCGKTYVLTQRFLSHLEPGGSGEGGATGAGAAGVGVSSGPVPVSHLVAITFTERAAREMRSRIRSECAKRLASCPLDEADYWLGVVRGLDNARISTFHSFCSGLLRSHAVEAGIDPRFQLLSETLAGPFVEETVAEAVREALAGADSDVEELAYQMGLSTLTEELVRLLPKRHRLDAAVWLAKTPEEIAEEWRRIWVEEAVPGALQQFARSGVGRGLLRCLADCPAVKPEQVTNRERLKSFLIGWAGDEGRPGDGERDLAGLAAIAGISKLLPNKVGGEEYRERLKEGLGKLKALLAKLARGEQVEVGTLLESIELGQRLLAVVERVGLAVDQAKRARGVLDFDDLILLSRNLLRDHPEIRQRVAGGIELLMVDEFQDTDPVQAELVRMLCGSDENLRRGRLFLVGDAKQSIYRFRNAEPGVFADLRAELPEAGRLPLSRNFRSQPDVLAFVNAVFDGQMAEVYEPLDAAGEQVSEEPCVELLLVMAGGGDGAGEGGAGDEAGAGEASRLPLQDGAEGDEGEEGGGDETQGMMLRRLEAEAIAARISQLVRGGARVVRDKEAGGLRAARCKDVVILLRAMSDVRLYEAALRGLELPYYVDGGRAFYSQQEIYDLANLCRAVDEPADDVALLGVLRSPLFGLADDTLYLIGERGEGLWVGLERVPDGLSEDQAELVRRARSILRELRAEKDVVSIADWLRLVFDRTGYDASVLGEFLGERKLANLEKLIGLAEEFDATGEFTLAGFASRLQAAVFEEAQEALAPTHPESADVVRLMTIHQSKGLEFPVVFVADLERKNPPDRERASLDPQLGPVFKPKVADKESVHLGAELRRLRESELERAERLRLFYVACTRAADLLILSSGMVDREKPRQLPLQTVAARYDLTTGLMTRDAETGEVAIPERSRDEALRVRVHPEPPVAIRPDERPSEGSGPRGVARFREIVRDAEPAEWPELARVIPVDESARLKWSVSELETIPKSALGVRGWLPLLSAGEIEIVTHASSRPEEELARELSDWTETDAERVGTLVHAVLERLAGGESIEVDQALAAACGAKEFEEQVVGAARRIVGTVVGSSFWSVVTSAARVEREVPFVLSGGRAVGPGEGETGREEWRVSGEIDLLLVSGEGEWSIVDYKTSSLGGENGGSRGGGTQLARARELLAKYELQLGAYVLALTEWTGRLPGRVSLVCLGNGVEEVAVRPSEGMVAAVREWIGCASQKSKVKSQK